MSEKEIGDCGVLAIAFAAAIAIMEKPQLTAILNVEPQGYI
jgi:hypothetical protein